MVNYTWENFAPFTLGLDETLSRLETFAGSGTNYPPYNIYNGSDSRTILEVALAGFSKEELSVATERNCLTVSAKKKKDDKKRKNKIQGRFTAKELLQRGPRFGKARLIKGAKALVFILCH